MRLRLAAFTALLLLAPVLTGCLGSGEPLAVGGDGTLVLTSVYPVNFLAERIGGDNVTVESVTGDGVAPHGWEPTARDIGRLAEADLLLVQGIDFETWLPAALESLGANAPPVVEVTEGVALLEASADHDHEDDGHPEDEHAEDDHDAHANESGAHEDEHGHDEDEAAPEPDAVQAYDGTGEPDPHTWLDPVRYAQQARTVEAALAQAFPAHADAFRERADALVGDLDALDAEFESGLAECNVRVVIVNHNAFAYLADRYGFSVLSVHGLSPESEPNAQTVKRLVDAARAYTVPVIFMEELANPRVVQVIADEVDAQVRVLSPIEGVGAADAAEGMDYLTLQEQNLQNLREGMRCL